MSRIFRTALLVCLASAPSLPWSTPAWSQPDVSATPPQALSSTQVPYPDGAKGDAVVVLELQVEIDGSVSEVIVVEGETPFSGRAREAAKRWSFEPARRGDTAVASRVRARVTFKEPTAPPPVEPSTRAGSVTSKPPTKSATNTSDPNDAPVEVEVLGERPEIGQTTLSTREIRALPGAFGDGFRAVESLPGVTPAMSGVPYFFIRGAPPNNNGYFVDGVRVPLLFHLGLGQSVIHPGLIDRVDFFSGAPPAKYGGFTGGIIAGKTRPPSGVAHGEASLRLVDAGALLETPFLDQRGTVLVAGRYGYPGPIVSAISDSRLDYWDYQSLASFRLNASNTLSLFAFGSHDYLGHQSGSEPVAKTSFRIFTE